jgi:predicted transposase/invertase (TIGR01784 family)
MKTDTLFYRLFQDRPALVFELAGLPTSEAAGFALRAEEIKQTAFRLDGLLIAEAAPEAAHPPVFLEIQFQPDADFYGRWFAELFLYIYLRKLTGEWRAVVVFPSRASDPVEQADDATLAAFRPLLRSPWVHRIHLEEDLPPSGEASTGLELIRLILANREQAADLARALVQNAPQSERRWVLDWVETILVYKLPQLNREEIRMILELQDVDLKQSRFYQEVFAEGQEDGLDKGREEGWKEGRKAEAVALVLRQLTRRCGPLASAVEARIAALPVDQIEQLGEALLDFTDASDLTAWLKALDRSA